MKKSTFLTNSKRLYCDVFGHNYKLSKQITYHVKEYKCSCCGKEVTTNSNGYLTELTPKFRDINAALSKIYANKLARMKRQRINTSAA
ncbi:MAG: hypothetical protein ED556_02230 [Winogradskyella sp.]|uniref:hypothetical protein n=1 Tax=Winogradskyella sp. TaxID=1883156 RepID=UPI000F3C268D|nr:hypothetical protein [Winogradskyella sp.]RNC88029.1 MAG: hypothetical protein ED556_02230 [Winogradskyella sp.]